MRDGVDLSERVVLVTGASQGIGLAMSRAFHARGARVAMTARARLAVPRARALQHGKHCHWQKGFRISRHRAAHSSLRLTSHVSRREERRPDAPERA